MHRATATPQSCRACGGDGSAVAYQRLPSQVCLDSPATRPDCVARCGETDEDIVDARSWLVPECGNSQTDLQARHNCPGAGRSQPGFVPDTKGRSTSLHNRPCRCER